MILLSLGTHEQPFSRAIDLVEPLAMGGESLVIQHGSSAPRPGMPNTTWVEFMPFDDVVETMAKADNIICHAGVGTIMTSLQAGHTPVVIPRRASNGEHVDDHQLDIATRFAERGLIRCFTPGADLTQLLESRGDHRHQQIGAGSTELRTAVSEAVTAGSRGTRSKLSLRQRRTTDARTPK